MKKRTSSLLLTIFMFAMAQAQNSALPPVDKSPLDMSYYPAAYPILKIQDKATEPLVARLVYSRPQKNGRQVFGELVEYGKVWRLGANEATEIEFYRDVKMGSTKVKKGRYTLYAIPTTDTWTIILNRETDTWGAFKYDQKKDVARITVKPETLNTDPVEYFTLYFDKAGAGFVLHAYWDNLHLSIPFGL
jgi:hypothetical protein